MEKQNPGAAAVLSFVFNGLGQIYNGQIKKGLTIMFFSSIAMLVTLIGGILLAYYILSGFLYAYQLIFGSILFLLGIAAIALIGIYNIYDAYNTAQSNLHK